MMTRVNKVPRTILNGDFQHVLIAQDLSAGAYAYLYASCREPNQLPMTMCYVHCRDGAGEVCER